MILKAAQFATIAHAGQKRKYNDLPYINHPARVAGRTSTLHEAYEEMIAAAYLHDVVEDTKTTFSDIKVVFNDEVVRIVKELTSFSKIVNSKEPRAIRKQMDREYLSSVSPEGKKIKMLDRIDNLNEMSGCDDGFLKLYLQESELLVPLIGDADLELKQELIYTISKLNKEV